jgi:hypothetical protein
MDASATHSPPTRWPRPARSGDGRAQVVTQLIKGRPSGRRQHSHHDVSTGVEPIQLGTQQVAQAAAQGVTGNRVAHRPRDHKPRSRPPRCLRRLAGVQMHHETIASGASSAPDDPGEVVRPP